MSFTTQPGDPSGGRRRRPDLPPEGCPNPAAPYAAPNEMRPASDLSPRFLLGAALVLLVGLALIFGLA